MSKARVRSLSGQRILLALILLAGIPSAHAQFAVFDGAAVAQLLTEVRTIEQEVVMTQFQLQAMTGERGMDRLLAGTNRNYLPTDWATVDSAMQGSSDGTFSTEVQAAQQANAVLTPEQLAALPPASSETILARRQSVALLQALTRVALATSSNRFSSLQLLIDAIARAGDQKASLDLNARIDAEQSMLQNDQTKLQALYQGALAQRWADQQRMHEQLIAAHGRFATRFQPVP